MDDPVDDVQAADDVEMGQTHIKLTVETEISVKKQISGTIEC